MKDPAAPPPRLRTRPVSPERLRQEATIAVLVARLVVRLLGPRAALVGRPCPRAATRRGRPTAGSIVEAAGRAARLWPRTSCLAEAIAARWLGIVPDAWLMNGLAILEREALKLMRAKR